MRKIIKTVLVIFLGFLVFLTGQTVRETIEVRSKIKKFVSLGVFQDNISNDKIKYYKVSRETFRDIEVYDRPPFFDNDLLMPGAEGDVFVTLQSPFPGYPGINEFVSFFFGGHAGYISNNNKVIEITGIPSGDESFFKVFFKGSDSTVANETSNYWLNPNYRNESDDSYSYFGSFYRKEWIGLRVKNVSYEDVELVTDFMKDLVDRNVQYNFQFILNTRDRYYCTDMMSRSYESIINNNRLNNIDLNSDGVAVTVNDLILSKDTYIAYYIFTDKNNVKHVYYIDN